jgi:polar amino acid transport system ATP-binding protein
MNSTSESSRALVEAVNVRKSFGAARVLNDVSLTVESGEVVVIVGPSGAGKSTFLRTLNQLESIDGGAIYIGGELVGYRQVKGSLVPRKPADVTRQRRKLGMVFQQFHLFPHMTVLQNITLAPMKVNKIGSKAAQEKALDLLSIVGLADRAGAYPNELSGGQQQRVAIARALAMEPAVLLFDEPTSALDPELVGDVLQVMRTLASGGQTMIVVTHEMKFARDVADRIVFMVDGRIDRIASPEEFFADVSSSRLASFLGRVDGGTT